MITNILDFDILDNDMNPRTIIVFDKSTYMDKYPETPKLDVLPPGHAKWVSLPFKTNDVNVITSSQLNLTCGEITTLPDGIYRFNLSVCPNDKVFLCKDHLRTVLLEYSIHDLVLRVMNNCDPESEKLKKKLIDIDCLLRGAKANVAIGNLSKGNELYQKAQTLTNNTLKHCK